MNNTCRTCDWCVPYEGVCVNGDNEHRADFMEAEEGCRWWKAKMEAK